MIGVLHVVDSLDPGGLERVAVNLVNALPVDTYRCHLCTTRRDGTLAALVRPHVGRLRLERRSRYDLRGIHRLRAFLRAEDISILHLHGSSLFVGAVAALFSTEAAVLWHDHYGRYLFDDRPSWLYRLASRKLSGIVSVNRPLVTWARQELCVPDNRVWYVPNFSVAAMRHDGARDGGPLPGIPGARIVCVANLRQQKDHATLLAAMAMVRREVPDAHLLLVGAGGDAVYEASLRRLAVDLGVDGHSHFLGHRDDVGSILGACDVGVLSSRSEGFPLALVEYGMASLASVATAVGECPEVLDEGCAGSLVPAADPAALAGALVALLRDAQRRRCLGEALRDRVSHRYTPQRIIEQLSGIYTTVLAERPMSPSRPDVP